MSEDSLSTTRRRLLGYLSLPAMLALTGGASAQTVRRPNDFNAVPVWIGPIDARPDPDADIFASSEGTVLYWADDTGTIAYLDIGADSWTVLPGSRPRLIDAITSDQVVSNTTIETTVFSPMIDSGGIYLNDVYELTTTGIYTTTNSTEKFTVRFHIGNTEVAAVTSVEANVTDATWYAILSFTVRETGTSGTVKPHVVAAFDNVHDDQHSGTVSLDTTVAENFDVTVQWDEANAGNEVLVGQAYLKRIGMV